MMERLLSMTQQQAFVLPIGVDVSWWGNRHRSRGSGVTWWPRLRTLGSGSLAGGACHQLLVENKKRSNSNLHTIHTIINHHDMSWIMVDTTIVNKHYVHNTHFDTNLLKVSSHLLSFIDATLQQFGKPLLKINPFYKPRRAIPSL